MRSPMNSLNGLSWYVSASSKRDWIISTTNIWLRLLERLSWNINFYSSFLANSIVDQELTRTYMCPWSLILLSAFDTVSILYAPSYSVSVFFPGILLFKFGKGDSKEGYDDKRHYLPFKENLNLSRRCWTPTLRKYCTVSDMARSGCSKTLNELRVLFFLFCLAVENPATPCF